MTRPTRNRRSVHKTLLFRSRSCSTLIGKEAFSALVSHRRSTRFAARAKTPESGGEARERDRRQDLMQLALQTVEMSGIWPREVLYINRRSKKCVSDMVNHYCFALGKWAKNSISSTASPSAYHVTLIRSKLCTVQTQRPGGVKGEPSCSAQRAIRSN